MLNKETAERFVEYDPIEGGIRWKARPSINANRIKLGAQAGNLFQGKYRQMSLLKKKYLVHHIVWLLHHGYLPKNIDHIDGNGLNNRIENLREANPSIQAKNQSRRKYNKSGITGVSWHKKARKWVVQSSIAGANVYLGLYSSLDEAAAVKKAHEAAHDFHPNHGRS